MTILHKIFCVVKFLRSYSLWVDFAKDSGNVEFINSCETSGFMPSCLLLFLLLLIFINGNILWNFQQNKSAINLILFIPCLFLPSLILKTNKNH